MVQKNILRDKRFPIFLPFTFKGSVFLVLIKQQNVIWMVQSTKMRFFYIQVKSSQHPPGHQKKGRHVYGGLY